MTIVGKNTLWVKHEDEPMDDYNKRMKSGWERWSRKNY